MSMDFRRFVWTLLLTTPSAVLLSVWRGVRGCGWPILANIFLDINCFAGVYEQAAELCLGGAGHDRFYYSGNIQDSAIVGGVEGIV